MNLPRTTSRRIKILEYSKSICQKSNSARIIIQNLFVKNGRKKKIEPVMGGSRNGRTTTLLEIFVCLGKRICHL